MAENLSGLPRRLTSVLGFFPSLPFSTVTPLCHKPPFKIAPTDIIIPQIVVEFNIEDDPIQEEEYAARQEDVAIHLGFLLFPSDVTHNKQDEIVLNIILLI